MTRRCEPESSPGIPTDDTATNGVIADSKEEFSCDGTEPGRMPGMRHTLYQGETTPQWVRSDLARLESAFHTFSFTIRHNMRGFRFEAWRDAAAGGLYALITDDPREMWHELEMAER